MSAVALVTGASSGLGSSIARRLARGGFLTFGTSRTARPSVDGVEMVELDVRSDESVAACLGEIHERAGGIDVLVNNAGVLDVGPAEERTLDEARAVFETNFFGVVRLTHAVLPEMRARGSGRIINIGSLAGLVAPPGEAFYSASKHALEGYSEALYYEVAPFGISVSIIEPGFLKTGLGESASELPGRIADYDELRPRLAAAISQSLQSGADPESVVDTIFQIVQAERPRLRYRLGRDAVWVPRMKSILPESLFTSALKRRFGIP